MSNICLKVTIEEKGWLTYVLKTYFLGLKNLSPGQSFEALTQKISLNFLLQLKSQRPGSKTVWVFYYFNFERN